jgi:hypothetical protein
MREHCTSRTCTQLTSLLHKIEDGAELSVNKVFAHFAKQQALVANQICSSSTENMGSKHVCPTSHEA